jgi:hypothetical protein
MATDPPQRALDPYHADRIPESKPMFGIGRPGFAAAIIGAIVIAVIALIVVYTT